MHSYSLSYVPSLLCLHILLKVKLFLADRKEVFVHEAFSAWIKFKKRMQRERRYTFAILRTKSKKYKFHRETHLKISLFNILVDNVYYMKQQYIKAETFYIEKVCKHKCKVSLRILKKYSNRKKRKRVLKEKIIWLCPKQGNLEGVSKTLAKLEYFAT